MRKFAVAIVFAFIASIVMAQVPGAVPFSADMTMKPAKSPDRMNGKMYFSGSKMRWDMSMRGRDSVMITDIPGKVSYMVMPQQKMYMEMRADQMQHGPKMDNFKSYDPNNPCANAEDMTCEKGGSETVNGRAADKWIFKKKSTGKLVMTTWLDKKIHFPVKSLMEDGTEMDLTNVQEGAPAASVFEIPAGYKKFDMGAMMGGQAPN